jgi:hypothetical protein
LVWRALALGLNDGEEPEDPGVEHPTERETRQGSLAVDDRRRTRETEKTLSDSFNVTMHQRGAYPAFGVRVQTPRARRVCRWVALGCLAAAASRPVSHSTWWSAARHQEPVLSGKPWRLAACRRPTGLASGSPHALVRLGAPGGAGRIGHALAHAPAGAGWHGVGGRGRWKRPFEFPILLIVLITMLTARTRSVEQREGGLCR